MSYEYRAQMMNGTIKDAKDNYENAEGNAEKEKYEIEIQRLQSLQNAYKTAGDYEAKAKAFDEIFKLYIGYEDGWINYPRGRMSFNKEIISVCRKYGSGEYDD